MRKRGQRGSAAQLAVFGARIRTLDPGQPFAEALALRDGRIIAVGSDSEVKEVCDARTTGVDGRDVCLTPGLVDAHIHPILGSELAVGVDLTAIRSRDDLSRSLRRARASCGADDWVRGWGLDYAVLADRPLDGRDLGDGPVFVLFFDMHTALASPDALRHGGVDGSETFADGAEVVTRDCVPTGELREASAFRLVLDAIPAANSGKTQEQAASVFRGLSRVGLTGVHIMDGTPATFDLLRELEANDHLTVRCVAALVVQPDTGPEEIEAFLRLRDERGGRWRGGLAKFYADGVVETGTAWLHAPDTEGAAQAPNWPDQRQFGDTVRNFARHGFQCATHAIGDRAVQEIAAIYRSAPAGAFGPHRIEHLETVDDGTLSELSVDEHAAAGSGSPIAISMQPLHMQWRREDGSDPWAVKLGPERALHGWRVRDLARATGGCVALGSDWPIASYDPREGMAWTRLRRHPGNRDGVAFEASQRLDGLSALLGYTTAAAAASGEHSVAGRISVGRRADLTAFAEDPVAVSADDLPELPIRFTIVDGQLIEV